MKMEEKKYKKFDCGCDEESGLLCAKHNDEMWKDLESGNY